MKIQIKDSKVSIIIVNYNNANFLIKSINSVLAQSYTPKEIGVIDGNSLDHSIKL